MPLIGLDLRHSAAKAQEAFRRGRRDVHAMLGELQESGEALHLRQAAVQPQHPSASQAARSTRHRFT